jgi:hypothetical protein
LVDLHFTRRNVNEDEDGQEDHLSFLHFSNKQKTEKTDIQKKTYKLINELALKGEKVAVNQQQVN